MMVMNDDDWEDKDINNHKRWGFNDKEKLMDYQTLPRQEDPD